MIPTIDPQVKHVGVSYLRKLNANNLRDLPGAIVVCENSEPLAVIVSVETYFRLQQQARGNEDGEVVQRPGFVRDVPPVDFKVKHERNYRRRLPREKGDTKR